jgi:hypothetical protein
MLFGQGNVWMYMKITKILVLFGMMLGVGNVALAQNNISEIQTKHTLFIPKLDLFWAGVVIAENFPTFFPLELECNIPPLRLSISPIFSAWKEKFVVNEQTKQESSSFIAGVGIRYYAALTKGVPGQGLFVEPQFFYRGTKGKTTFQANNFSPIIETPSESKETAFMGAVGYQHVFLQKIHLQGRVSVGYSEGSFMKGFRKDNLLFLPWIGIGYGF